MDTLLRTQLITGLRAGDIVPYLGPGVLADSTLLASGEPLPATSEQLILAMNGGKPMAAKLMYEFSRAAMNVELKRGRGAVTRFLDATYADKASSRAAFHDWLAQIEPPYVIDINRDSQLLDSYAGVAHLLIVGCARIVANGFRYKLYSYDGQTYTARDDEQLAASERELPILFKPMGAPRPEPCYIASDADYVDYITELMGGFAVPRFVKTRRRDKRYLLLGLRLNRDSERMVLSDLIYAAGSPAGWALIEEASDKERRFLKRQGIALIEGNLRELMSEAAVEGAPADA